MFNGRQKSREFISLHDLELTGIPLQSSLVFIKAKQGRINSTTSAEKIVENSVNWPSPLNITCHVPSKSPTKKRGELLRLSIRIENTSGRGFTRYGIAEIDLAQMKLSDQKHISIPLSNCLNNSILNFRITFDNLEPSSNYQSITKDQEKFISQEADSEEESSEIVSSSSQTISPNDKIISNVNPERLLRLEQQVDEIITRVIIP